MTFLELLKSDVLDFNYNTSSKVLSYILKSEPLKTKTIKLNKEEYTIFVKNLMFNM